MENPNRTTEFETKISKLLTEIRYLKAKKRVAKIVTLVVIVVLTCQFSKSEELQSRLGIAIASLAIIISTGLIKVFGEEIDKNDRQIDLANINIKMLSLPAHANKDQVKKQLLQDFNLKEKSKNLSSEIWVITWFIVLLILSMPVYLIMTQLYYSLGFGWYDWIVYPAITAGAVWSYFSNADLRKQRNLVEIDRDQLTKEIKEAKQDPLGLYENSKRPGQVIKR